VGFGPRGINECLFDIFGFTTRSILRLWLGSTGTFAESAKTKASQASMWAAQSAVRDARDQVQRRPLAQHRWYQR
jgi:hypothetical protein